MEDDTKKIDNSIPSSCPLCGRGPVTEYARKNGHKVYVCAICHFLFVYPIPNSAEVYDKSYFSGAEKGFGYVDYDSNKEPMRPTFEKYLGKLSSAGLSSGSLLDVGCATGFFMSIARERGFETVGVELSEFAADQGRQKGLSIMTGDLSSARFPAGSFDVVTLCDVLEHVPDPKEFLREVRRVLRPGGFLLVNTPDATSTVARLLGRRWHLIVPPEHLHYFSPKNLEGYLFTLGFSVRMSASIGKRFTLGYIFKTLYAWQKFLPWKWLAYIFSRGFLSRLYIPLNTRDNFFLIAQKGE